jgi:hypothetical protein
MTNSEYHIDRANVQRFSLKLCEMTLSADSSSQLIGKMIRFHIGFVDSLSKGGCGKDTEYMRLRRFWLRRPW